MRKAQFCPICRAQVHPDERYPHYICAECTARAVDENARPLRFYNRSLSGGFVAVEADTGVRRDSHLCWIDGLACWADEARFGGIVIQPVESMRPGS